MQNPGHGVTKLIDQWLYPLVILTPFISPERFPKTYKTVMFFNINYNRHNRRAGETVVLHFDLTVRDEDDVVLGHLIVINHGVGDLVLDAVFVSQRALVFPVSSFPADSAFAVGDAFC